MTPAEGPAAAEGEGHHDEDDEGAEVGPQVFLHDLFHDAGEGEHADDAKGEQQLERQDAKHLQEKVRDVCIRAGTLPR